MQNGGTGIVQMRMNVAELVHTSVALSGREMNLQQTDFSFVSVAPKSCPENKQTRKVLEIISNLNNDMITIK